MALTAAIVVVAAAMTAGWLISTRTVPGLAADRTGRVATAVVAGLAGAALSEIGLHTFGAFHSIHQEHVVGAHGQDGLIVASNLRAGLFNAAVLLAIASIVHVLARRLQAAA